LFGGAFHDRAGNNWMLFFWFNLSLQVEVFFEANLLHMASLMAPSQVGLSEDKYKEMLLSRRGAVLQKLYARIQRPALRTSDATILAVTCLIMADVRIHKVKPVRCGLMAFQCQMGNDEHVLLHGRGLNELVRLKEGQVPGDCPPLLLLCVRLTQAICSFALQRSLAGTINNECEYPVHPYPAALLALISDLPSGFSELALNCQLSYQVIILLHRCSRGLKDNHERMADIDVSDLMELSTNTQASPLERDIGILLALFSLPFNTNSGRLSRQTYTRTHHSSWAPVSHLIERILAGFDGSVELDFIVWATILAFFMLEHINIAAPKNVCTSWNEQESLLNHLILLSPTLSLDDMRSMAKRHFWRNSLEPGLVRTFTMMDGLRYG
jgi:hypothetical protein